jgi:2-methylaconitate cis-trans-isomerase PrpF
MQFTLMRGGTSKGIFIREEDLPADPHTRDAVILSLFGSPDRRQIDGLGGADPLTSKVAIIGAPREPGTDITYTFGQVEIDRPSIDYASPCGNVISAVGAYAVHEGFVTPRSPVTLVRVYNTNLERLITIEVPVEDGKPVEKGNFSMPGVPGTGARIGVDFSQTAGGACGALLPTGNVKDRFTLPDGSSVDVSLVDIANPHVYVRARDFGLTGTETAAEIDGNPALLARIEDVRGMAAVKFGLVDRADKARIESRVTPMLAFVAEPQSYRDASGRAAVGADAVDLVSRLIFLEKTHNNYAATSIVCAGVAARLPGSLVHEVTRPDAANRPSIRIGHPLGVVDTEASVETSGDGFRVTRAVLGRTARRLAKGEAFIDAGD